MKFLFALVAMTYASTDACDEAQQELADAVAADLHTNSTDEAWMTVSMLEIDCKLNCDGVEGAICDAVLSPYICENPEPARESRTITPIWSL